MGNAATFGKQRNKPGLGYLLALVQPDTLSFDHAENT
jgi:hypothetical protein